MLFLCFIFGVTISQGLCADPDQNSWWNPVAAYRSAVGAMLWATIRTRPDMAYMVNDLSTKMGKATVQDLIAANDAVKEMKATELQRLRQNR